MDITALTQLAKGATEALKPTEESPAALAARLDAPDAAAVADFRDALQGGEPIAEPRGGAGIAGVLAQDQLGHADIFRVQVMACMASFQAQKNSSVVSAMTQGLSTLVKSDG